MLLTMRAALVNDVLHILRVRNSAARALTQQFGDGPWTRESTERGALNGLRHSRIILAFENNIPVGTYRITTHKPWAIDRAFFTPVLRPLYLTDMAVAASHQRAGVGRALIAHAEAIARAHPAQAIWLDAYDADAGAGLFYAKCGFRECGRTVYRGAPLVYYEKSIVS